MIGNPRGYGKSALIAEMAYTRDTVCAKKGYPSGPVLFTDFLGVKTADDAEDRILATIQPLFLPQFAQLFDGRGTNNYCILISSSVLYSLKFYG